MTLRKSVHFHLLPEILFDERKFVDDLHDFNELISPDSLELGEILLANFSMIEVGSPVLVHCILVDEFNDQQSAIFIVEAIQLVCCI